MAGGFLPFGLTAAGGTLHGQRGMCKGFRTLRGTGMAEQTRHRSWGPGRCGDAEPPHLCTTSSHLGVSITPA